jgi:hypothetical protein
MLRCIICRFEQATIDALGQRSTLCKGLVKIRKVNGITPMIIHVKTTHPKLFVLRKQQLSAMAKFVVAHVRQSRKKMTSIFNCAIIAFFGVTNLYKTNDEHQQQFLKYLVLYTCKGYKPLSNHENI